MIAEKSDEIKIDFLNFTFPMFCLVTFIIKINICPACQKKCCFENRVRVHFLLFQRSNPDMYQKPLNPIIVSMSMLLTTRTESKYA